MKLRIRDNSVRLRLTKSELKLLCDKQLVECAVGFPGGQRLRYAVATVARCKSIMAEYGGDRLLISLPVDLATAWANSEQITLSADIDLGEDQLSILVEKDFACLAPREGEDESDMFPNPQQGIVSC